MQGFFSLLADGNFEEALSFVLILLLSHRSLLDAFFPNSLISLVDRNRILGVSFLHYIYYNVDSLNKCAAQ